MTRGPTPPTPLQVGQNWNQLVYELNKWLILGRELEAVSNDRENKAF